MKVISSCIKRWLAAAVIAAASTVGLSNHALAQFGDAGGITSRPATLEFMLNDVNRLIANKQGDYTDHKKKLLQRSGRGVFEREIQRLARGGDELPFENEISSDRAAAEILDRIGNDGDRWAFFHGADLGELVTNHIHDIQTIISRIMSCLKFRLLGICIKIGFFDIDITLIVRYSFPTVKIETVDQPFKSGYFPRLLVDLPVIGLRHLSEAVYYPLAPTMVQLGVTRAQLAGQTLGSMYQARTNPAPQQGADSEQAIGLAMGSVLGYDGSMRWTSRQSRTSGHRNVEYHLMPEFFNTTVGNAPPWCHKIRSPWWFSDWPLMIIPARFAGMSMILWPSTMIPMTFIPQVCTFKNIKSGKTPMDMAFPLAFPEPGDIIPGKAGCQGVNAGGVLPVTNTAQSVHFTDASRVGTMKAIKVATKLIPGRMYTYQPAKGDKFQWSRNDRMPRGCGSIEKWKLSENKLANSVKGKDPWNVAILWTRFTCCLNWRNKNPTFTIPHTSMRQF